MPQKAQTSTRDHLQKCMDAKCLDIKLNVLDSTSDALNMLHKMSQHRLRSTKFNELRPYLLAERYEFEPYKLNANKGTLKVYGYVRGRHLNANSLVHLPSLGY
jgi:pre-rRNA-processing protein TSR1